MNMFYYFELDGSKTSISDSEAMNLFREKEIFVLYRCYHCGDIDNNGGVVVHKNTCKIGADQRLNSALWMIDNLKNHIIANDVSTPRVMEYLAEFEGFYK